MEDGKYEGTDDTDELLCTDAEGEEASDFHLGTTVLCRDHCDLLLDAIDDQLSQLQTRRHGQTNGGNGKTEDILHAVHLERSKSVSKDTGLGTTNPPTDKTVSTPDGSISDPLDKCTEAIRNRIEERGQQEGHNEHFGLFTATSWQTVGAAGSGASRSEQCLWRLERLLGATDGVAGQEAEEESVCTEDFSSRFRDVMLEVPEPSANGAGVPLRSLDLVTTDSDLDSVCMERVQRHTLDNKTVWEGLGQNGSRVGRPNLTHTQQHEDQMISSDDEGEVKGECVRHCRMLSVPNSIQRRKKRNQSQRNNSTPATPSTSFTPSTPSKRKQDGKLRMDCSDTELSLLELHQKKAAVVQMVQSLRVELEQAERERNTLYISLSHSRAHTQVLRSEQHKLKVQRDSCVKEARDLQENQVALQKQATTCNHGASPHRTTHYYDSSPHITGCYYDDSLHRRLEEVTQDLEQQKEVNRKLRERCSHLEEKLATADKHREELQDSVQIERVEQGRVGALEKMVAQKEMLLLDMQEEKSSLEKELRANREEHSTKLTAELAHLQKEKEQDIERLRSQWTLAHEQEMQLVHHQAHEAKVAALRDQALTHTRSTESLHNCIKIKGQEVARLQESLEQQQVMLRRREEELKRETQEQVNRAVAREQRKWERQMAESLRGQHGILEERMKEVERERRTALTLQNKALELQRRVEELEREASAQTAVLQSLRDEQQAELEGLRTHLLKKAESEAVLLKQCVKHSEQEIQDLKAALAESRRCHQGAAARQEQQSRSWAQDIRMECVWLQELLRANGIPADTKPLSHSGTVSETLQVLQLLRNPLQDLITSLKNNITSLTHTTQQLSADKEVDLRLQREQLTAEKESALDSLKEKLIQEHIEELSCVSRLRLHEDDDDGGSMAANLRKQLKAKDEELRQVQRYVAHWKEKTTARLAHRFEEELTSELERWKVDWFRRRRTSRPRSEQQRRLDQLEGETRHVTGDCCDNTDVHPASASSSSVPDTPRSQDLTSYKLLRHLQCRIRQLQADSQIRTPSPACLIQGRQVTDLAGSYLETIGPAPESCVTTTFQEQHPADAYEC
ncbi:trichohyalin isoform X2 [Electrophorus electricus]|uniref:trichohyalin isoform X2 n=1 Tax=Electrophorus electricus TaxID=8005 RepID=UPI0015CFA431|nr:trichohyalin isoform X2 [Electrophorus electricus]